jgi:hypothetical protein
MLLPPAVLAALLVLNEILNAGNAITAFSLLLYSLTFNLRERVARAFAFLMACVVVGHFGDVLVGTSSSLPEVSLWLRLQWLAIGLMPAAYLHLSDALLAATGRPSRGRRDLAIRIGYVVGAGLAGAAILSDFVVVDGVAQQDMAAYLRPGPLFYLYVLFMTVSLAISGRNLYRAYQRCLTRTSRRRMLYLMLGAIGPVLSIFPFLTFFGPTMLVFPSLFWLLQILTNVYVAISLVLMAYSVAYFGVSYPDRVVKSRLFQWILRGPVVASTVLSVTVLVNRFAESIGLEQSRLVPFAMVGSLLLLQLLITLIRPPIERWLFYGVDRADVERLHLLEERLLTSGDLRQFLESILNAVCDIHGTDTAFIAVVGQAGIDLEVAVGPGDLPGQTDDIPPLLMSEGQYDVPALGKIFNWGSNWLIPLRTRETSEMIGLLAFQARSNEPDFSNEEAAALSGLADKAAVALTDRRLQREVFAVVDRLVPQVEEIQRMRAASYFTGVEAFESSSDFMRTESDLVNLVREALGHYWGGPRLLQSPLLGLRVVRQSIEDHDGNPVNALRAILKRGIDRTRPEGERRFTAEWMLYNILEMKFLEGRKVRDVALRLAMSEADLYRKQRVAIEAVAQAIAEMEREAGTNGANEDPPAPARGRSSRPAKAKQSAE